MNRSCAIGCVLWLCSATAFAHHSFAVFDSDKSITVHGTVVNFQWVNPHCWLDLDVMTGDGQVEKWGFEGAPPLMLRNQGVSKDSFKVGDKVIVTAHPRKDGTHAGSLLSVTSATGEPIMAPRPGAAPAPAASSSGSAP